MKRLSIVVLAASLCACTDPQGATKTLQDAGITPTHVGGYSWFGCGKGDTYATKFQGVNPQGRPVSGVVCSGLFFKNSTVRYN